MYKEYFSGAPGYFQASILMQQALYLVYVTLV